jgi:hypothetical protein
MEGAPRRSDSRNGHAPVIGWDGGLGGRQMGQQYRESQILPVSQMYDSDKDRSRRSNIDNNEQLLSSLPNLKTSTRRL